MLANVCFVPEADSQRLILPATSEQVVMPLKYYIINMHNNCRFIKERLNRRENTLKQNR